MKLLQYNLSEPKLEEKRAASASKPSATKKSGLRGLGYANHSSFTIDVPILAGHSRFFTSSAILNVSRNK